MDFNTEKLLADAELPGTTEDLKNSTTDYVVNLTTAFLEKLNIDVNVLEKPTFEQHNVMPQSEDIIKLINLQSVMQQICNRILLSDNLCVSDFTNPAPKRIRKYATILANFVLYTSNKNYDLQEKIEGIQNRDKMKKEYSKQINDIREKMNKLALYNAEQLSLIEKYTNETETVRSSIKRISSQKSESEAQLAAAEEKHQTAMQLYTSYKSELSKTIKHIAEMEVEIGPSLEEIKTRLHELLEQRNIREEKRDTLQEALKDKMNLVERFEKNLKSVQEQLSKFSEGKKILKLLKDLNTQHDEKRKNGEKREATIAELEKKLTQCQKKLMHGQYEVQVHAKRKKAVSHVHNSNAQLQREKEVLDNRLLEEQKCYNQICMENSELQKNIKQLEDQISEEIKNCQELYDNEIKEEIEFRKNILGNI